MLSSGPLSPKNPKIPNSIRYHITDIYIDELEKVQPFEAADEDFASTVEQLIEPFEKLAEGGSDKTARIKAKELLDDARLHADSDEEVEAEDKNEEDEEMEDYPAARRHVAAAYEAAKALGAGDVRYAKAALMAGRVEAVARSSDEAPSAKLQEAEALARTLVASGNKAALAVLAESLELKYNGRRYVEANTTSPESMALAEEILAAREGSDTEAYTLQLARTRLAIEVDRISDTARAEGLLRANLNSANVAEAKAGGPYLLYQAQQEYGSFLLDHDRYGEAEQFCRTSIDGLRKEWEQRIAMVEPFQACVIFAQLQQGDAKSALTTARAAIAATRKQGDASVGNRIPFARTGNWMMQPRLAALAVAAARAAGDAAATNEFQSQLAEREKSIPRGDWTCHESLGRTYGFGYRLRAFLEEARRERAGCPQRQRTA